MPGTRCPMAESLSSRATEKHVREDHGSGLREGPYICLSVADSGIGMDEATQARAVEPFFSTKGVGKGTGLGLSMAHGLAAQLGGGLTINSAPGEGTVVSLWLPISTDAVDRGVAQTIASSASRARGRALLVDDENLVRMSTADMLSDLGYEVFEAASAEEALRLIEDGVAPDVLVTDHMMPGMNGEQLARTLRAKQPKLPVLIVSGYAEAAGIAADLPRLAKPFRNADLAARLAIVHPQEAWKRSTAHHSNRRR